MKIHADLDELAQIRPEERDHYLRLGEQQWGGKLQDERGWERRLTPSLHYARFLLVHDDEPGDIGMEQEKTGEPQVEELIFPFPSVPIYGINRKTEYGKKIDNRTNIHSIRLLRRPGTAPIRRLFVLHNGLNEAESLKFYYQLADWIMAQQEKVSGEEGVACLVVPFPGHLTDASFHGPFAETPLSRYLNDAGELFRQFLRYMVGFRWLLGMVADSDAENWMVGGRLIEFDSVFDEIDTEASTLHGASEKRLKNNAELAAWMSGEKARDTTGSAGATTGRSQVEQSTRLLRMALGRDEGADWGPLRIHVVGYSLGGFVAQSVFFAWPQAISSCTTICSGGAISALAPTAFAEPEEWQSVLHALRPELTNSMLQGRLGDDGRISWPPERPVETVAGMPLEQYGYYQRIFEQVFLQEDRDSYKERLSEYSLRMLFVSGGEDPIVPPANILDASPREGTTMLSVAGMTHFLHKDPKDDGDRREAEQRDFWLPEAGRLIARAAIHAEQVHMHERVEATARREETARDEAREAIGRGSSKKLSDGYMFEEALDWVLEAVNPASGWLFLCRNAVPAAFLPPDAFRTWGTALHHHDLRVQRYALGLRHRAEMLEKLKDRTTLIVPEQLRHWFVDLDARFAPHSDSPSGRETSASNRREIWAHFECEWWQCIRHFDSGNIGSAIDGSLNTAKLVAELSRWLDVDPAYLEATYLPDVWVGIQHDASLVRISGEREDDHRGFINGLANIYEDLVKVREAERRKEKTPPTIWFDSLKKDLSKERVRIVEIAGTEFNPRYRGRIEKGPRASARTLARVAVGLIRSAQILKPHG